MMRAALLVLAAAAASSAASDAVAERGFLLAATKKPISMLRRQPAKDDDLGALLRDICATAYPATVVVGDADEAKAVRDARPCKSVNVTVLGGGGGRRRTTDVRLRYFKVGAIAEHARLYPGGTLYLDCDVALRRDAVDELFGVFDALKRKGGKALGLSASHICAPKQHHVGAGVAHSFCERNGGMIFLGDAPEAADVAREWLDELRRHTSADGHDQMPLRKVLWNHRDALHDVPKDIQLRSHKRSPCDGRPLLWHWHRADRVNWAKKKKHGAAEVCGFVV